jgi:hypothetical protein
MTIEQLLDLPTDELGRLDERQIGEVLQKYLPFTRPARARDTISLNIAGADERLKLALEGKLEDPNAPQKRKLKL